MMYKCPYCGTLLEIIPTVRYYITWPKFTAFLSEEEKEDVTEKHMDEIIRKGDFELRCPECKWWSEWRNRYVHKRFRLEGGKLVETLDV